MVQDSEFRPWGSESEFRVEGTVFKVQVGPGSIQLCLF